MLSQPLDIFSFMEPLITIVALLLTGLNWVINQRLNTIYTRLSDLETSIQKLQKIKNKVDLIYNCSLFAKMQRKDKRK